MARILKYLIYTAVAGSLVFGGLAFGQVVGDIVTDAKWKELKDIKGYQASKTSKGWIITQVPLTPPTPTPAPKGGQAGGEPPVTPKPKPGPIPGDFPIGTSGAFIAINRKELREEFLFFARDGGGKVKVEIVDAPADVPGLDKGKKYLKIQAGSEVAYLPLVALK